MDLVDEELDEARDRRLQQERRGLHLGDQAEVVEVLRLRMSHCASDDVWREDHVRVREENPLTCRGFNARVHGMDFPKPALWQGLDVDDADVRGVDSQALKDRARGVGRAVVHRDDLEAGVVQLEERPEGALDGVFFVARRDDQAHRGPSIRHWG